MESIFLSNNLFNPLDNKKLNSLKTYLENLNFYTTNQDSLFFLNFLKSLLNNSSSWNELIQGKSFTISSDPAFYSFLNSVNKELSTYGFDLSIKYLPGSKVEVKINLNLNELAKNHILSYINKNKTPFDSLKLYNQVPKKTITTLTQILNQAIQIKNQSEKVSDLIDVYKTNPKLDLQDKDLILKAIKNELDSSIISKDAKATEDIFYSIFINLSKNDILKMFDHNIKNLTETILNNSMNAKMKIGYLNFVLGFKNLSKDSQDIILHDIHSQIQYLKDKNQKAELDEVKNEILLPRFNSSKNNIKTKINSFIKEIDEFLSSSNKIKVNLENFQPTTKDKTDLHLNPPAGITFDNRQYIPPKTAAQEQNLAESSSALNLIFDFDALENISKGNGKFEDYLSVSLDIATIAGIGLFGKGIFKGGKYLFKFLKDAQKVKEFKELSLLEKTVLASNPHYIKQAIEKNIPFKTLAENFLKYKKVKNTEKFLKKAVRLEENKGVLHLFDKNSKLIGIMEGENIYKVGNKLSIYFSSAMNIGFSGWIAKETYDAISLIIDPTKILDYVPNFVYLPPQQQQKIKNEIINIQLKHLGLTFTFLKIASFSQEKFSVILNKIIKENKPVEVLAQQTAKELNIPTTDSFYSNYILPMVKTFSDLKSKFSAEQINNALAFVFGYAVFVGLNRPTYNYLENKEKNFISYSDEAIKTRSENISSILFFYDPSLQAAYDTLLRYLSEFGVNIQTTKDGLGAIVHTNPKPKLVPIGDKYYYLDLSKKLDDSTIKKILKAIDNNKKNVITILIQYGIIKEF